MVVSNIALCSPLPGIMIQFDSYFSNGLKPATGRCLVVRLHGQDVVSTAVSLSLGEAIVATANGDVVAAKDMVTWSLGSRSAGGWFPRIGCVWLGS